MSTLHIDPDLARHLIGELLDAADHLPPPTFPAPREDRFSRALCAAVSHLDSEATRVHGHARALAVSAHRTVADAGHVDAALAHDLSHGPAVM